MSMEPTVFIVDDDEAVRNGLAMMSKSVGLATKGFSNAQDFLDSYDPLEPGCLVLDVRMPGMSGLKLQEELAEREIDLPIIFLTGHGDVPMSIGAMQAGAVDFIEKPPKGETLIKAIRNGIELDRKRRQQAAEVAEIAERLARLTKKERNVLKHIAGGASDKEIASELGVTTRAVAYNRANILKKFEVETTVQLASIAADFDLL